MRTKTTEKSRDLVQDSHILEAARKWDAGINPYRFGKSVKFDVLINGKLYPPKAICGIAYELVTGEALKPADFPGAKDGPWHSLLKKYRFPIIPKTPSGIDEDVTDEDLPAFDAVSTEELRRLASTQGEKFPTMRVAEVHVFERSRYVRLLALRLANGICAGCRKPAPFNRKANGQPYLEVHHKTPLSRKGEDREENTEALCPNCHRQRHDILGLRDGEE